MISLFQGLFRKENNTLRMKLKIYSLIFFLLSFRPLDFTFFLLDFGMTVKEFSKKKYQIISYFKISFTKIRNTQNLYTIIKQKNYESFFLFKSYFWLPHYFYSTRNFFIQMLFLTPEYCYSSSLALAPGICFH